MSNFAVVVPHGKEWHFLDEVDEINPETGRVKGKYHFKNGATWDATHHFENMPIMPGVRQLSLMIEAACDTFHDSSPCNLMKMQNVKFLSMIEPGAEINVWAHAKQEADQTVVNCDLYTHGTDPVSQATLIFANKIVKKNIPICREYVYTGTEKWRSNNGIFPSEMLPECIAHNTIQIAQTYPGIKDKIFVFQGIKHAEFGSNIHPDSTIDLISTINWIKTGSRGTADGVAMVDSNVVARATIEFACLPARMR